MSKINNKNNLQTVLDSIRVKTKNFSIWKIKRIFFYIILKAKMGTAQSKANQNVINDNINISGQSI
jgi:hypothetical protein